MDDALEFQRLGKRRIGRRPAGYRAQKFRRLDGFQVIEAELVTGRCIVCHSVDYIEMNAPVLDRAGWEKTVRKMIDRFGAPITDGEAQQIVEYLGKHYSR